MTDSTANLAEKIEERFSNELIHCITDCDQVTVVLAADHLLSVCKGLHDDEQFAFTQLSDLCGVDYSTYGQVDWSTNESTSTCFGRGRQNIDQESSHNTNERFAVVYHPLPQYQVFGVQPIGLNERRLIYLASCLRDIRIYVVYSPTMDS